MNQTIVKTIRENHQFNLYCSFINLNFTLQSNLFKVIAFLL